MNTYIPSNSNPWDSDKIQFVSRRLGFGCSLSDLDKYSNYTPEQTIDDIVENAKLTDFTAVPEWADWDNKTVNSSGNNKA